MCYYHEGEGGAHGENVETLPRDFFAIILEEVDELNRNEDEEEVVVYAMDPIDEEQVMFPIFNELVKHMDYEEEDPLIEEDIEGLINQIEEEAKWDEDYEYISPIRDLDDEEYVGISIHEEVATKVEQNGVQDNNKGTQKLV